MKREFSALQGQAFDLHHSVGGKVTSAREDAACIVDVVSAALNIDDVCSTGHRGSPWKPQQDFSNWLEESGARAQRLSIDAESAKWLLRRLAGLVAPVLGWDAGRAAQEVEACTQ